MYSAEEIESKRLRALALKKKSASLGNTPTNGIPETNKNNRYNLHSTTTNSRPISKWNKSSPGVLRQQQAQQIRYDPIKSNNFYTKSHQKITGNIHMIAFDRFSVDLSKFYSPVIDVFRTIPSKAYGIIYYFILY